jgi:chromosome transmission fidelity protein 4
MQVMEFRVFNISKMTQELKGRVALTPGSRLTWIGFSEEGSLSSYDSEGVLRVFTSQYGGSWIPVFSTSKEKKQEENYWVVGLNTSSLYCIACKYAEMFPQVYIITLDIKVFTYLENIGSPLFFLPFQVTPKPILTILDLSLPLASSDLGAASLENELILKQLRLYETQRKVDDMALVGVDTTALEDEAFDLEVSQDKCILRLISSCCSSDSFARASELMELLTLEKSMRAAITLVTKLKLPFLAEKFSSILEERLLEEASEAAVTNPALNPNGEVVTRVESKVQNPPASIQTSENTEAVMKSSATKLSAPTLLKKSKVSEGLKLGKEQTKKDKSDDAKIKEIKKLNLKNPVNNVNKEDKGQEKEVNQGEARRSSNPFLKSTV